ncbi:hypothetical protein SAMN04489740_2613 [Arthrobacter alpinus]|uniref:Uncharacterized protein n=1 Tax=Arthrobacter alpinus TaxID=656366 RepID=A0A1H5LUF7_9MICC|nr:hypothetical protein [Arthrobacter alpinus]SEE80624.1 hypothetical protein SAMN04489740_2613 [Arthrobacter alpinus]
MTGVLKGLFTSSRQAKRDDAELGKGVWRRTHDRFRRGLDRFHQMLEGLEEAGAAPNQSQEQAAANYQAMVIVANNLAELLPAVRAIAMGAQIAGPSEGMEIPTGTGGYLNDVHRELSRAGNALAATAEALALLRLGAGEVSGVELKAALVHQQVDRAAELLNTRKSTGG